MCIRDRHLDCRLVTSRATLSQEIEEAIEQLADKRVHAKVEGTFAVGVDIGRTRNTTEIFIGGVSTTDTYPLRLAITLDAVDFADQESVMTSVLRKLPIQKMFIDRTGMGRNLAENMEKKFGGKVEGVDFTSGTKTLWATDAKMLIQQRRTPMPVDRDLSYQIHSIKKIITGSKNLVFDTTTNEKHHADKFWAWALMLSAANAGRMTGKKTAGAMTQNER
jgi:phage FluMu gp28-like protein